MRVAKLKWEMERVKRNLEILVVLAVVCFGLSALAAGKDQPVPVSGTWACVAHGADEGDTQFTFNLTQDGDKVTGHFEEASSFGEKAEITYGSFKDQKLEMHFDAHEGTAAITGTLTKKGEMSGTWSHSSGGQGTWECKTSTASK